MAGPGPRIYLCATEWCAVLADEEGAAAVAQLLVRARAGEFEVVGSELLRIEVLNLRTGTSDDADKAEEFLEANVRTWAAMDRRVAGLARALRVEMALAGENLKGMTPDLIHVATAMVGQVDAFITDDGDCRSVADRARLDSFGRGEYPPGQLQGL